MSHTTYADDCRAAFKIVDLATLRTLIADANAEVERRASVEKAKKVEEIRALIASSGLSAKEVMAIANGKTPATFVKTFRYKHPELPDVGWTGMGKRPKWVVDWIEKHGNADALKIAA